MPYNKKKGGKSHKKGKKPSNINNQIVFREDGEEYAIVQKMLGGSRCEVLLPDNTTKIAIIPGKMRRRSSWISTNDLLLVSIRDFEESKCDVLFRYFPTQINILKRKKMLSEIFIKQLTTTDALDHADYNINSNICFQDSDSDSDTEFSFITPKKEIITSTTNDTDETNFELDWDEI